MVSASLQVHSLFFLSMILMVNSQTPGPTSIENPNIMNVSEIWGYGFLAGFGISAIGFLTALLIVCIKNLFSDTCFELTIKFLFSLSFGALLGDAMLHILPGAYMAEGSDLCVVAGIFIGSIIFFIILESFSRMRDYNIGMEKMITIMGKVSIIIILTGFRTWIKVY